MTAAPVSLGGSLQTTALKRREAEGTKQLTFQQLASINADTYIWQPWFARLNGRLAAAYENTSGDDSGQSINTSGEATLAVLPRSKYPTTLSFAHIDSRIEGDFSGEDFVQDRASLNARAQITDKIRSGLRATYDNVRREESGDVSTITVDFDGSKAFDEEDGFLNSLFGVQNMGLSAGFRSSEFTAKRPEDSDASRDIATVTLTSDAKPFKDATTNSYYLFTYDDQDEENDTFKELSLQTFSTLRWRPEEKPYFVTGTLRGLFENVDRAPRDARSETTSTTTNLITGTASATWPINDQLNVSGGVRGSYEKVKRGSGGAIGSTNRPAGEDLTLSVFGSGNYISEKHQVGTFDWRWDSRALLDVGIRGDEGFVTRDSISLGHRFERELQEVYFVPVQLAFDQEAEFRYDTDDIFGPFFISLTNGLSLRYTESFATGSHYGRLLLRDRRDLVGGSNDQFQLAQIRFGYSKALSEDQRLLADLSAQYVRQVTNDRTDNPLSLSANVSYRHRDLFAVENLDFTSELRINAINLDQLFSRGEDNLSQEIARNDWRNVLSYRIGRLTASLEGSLFLRDDRLGYLTLFRLRRDFNAEM